MCEQEVVESVVMARCTKGMAQLANPPETDMNTNRTPMLGEEPAMRDCGVDEGNRMECNGMRLQQTDFYCEETNQRNANTNKNLLSAYKLLLEGEWTGYASGEVRDPEGDAIASDAATERADCPSESRETADANGVESEGRREGMSKSASIDATGDDTGRGVEPADAPIELETLDVMSIELEDLRSSGIPRVFLGCMSWCAGDTNGPGNRADGSDSQMDGSRGLADELKGSTDVSGHSSNAEMANISQGDSMSTYLGTGHAKHSVMETDGIETHADASSGRGDALNIEMDTIKPANKMDNVRTLQRIEKSQNSPNAHGIATPKRAYQWRKVNTGNSDVYVLLNVQIAAPSRKIAFGRFESGEKAIVPDVEGERACDGDGDGSGGDGDDGGVGDVDGTMSSGSIDSNRVKTVLLAEESQHILQSRRTRIGDLPVSSGSPIQPADRPYGPVRWHCRCGRLKIKSIKVCQLETAETTHLGLVHSMQPPWNDSKCLQRVVGPCHRHDRMKIVSVMLKIKRINGKKAQDGEMTYLERAQATQPLVNPPRRACGVIGPKCRCGHIKSIPTNVNQTRISRNTYLGRGNVIRSTWRPKKNIIRLNKLTFKYRMQGEPWHDDGDHG